MKSFDFTDHDQASGVTYTPWTDGWAVGFEVTYPAEFGEPTREFFYLNPSGDSDDGVPTVFVYQGPEGDPGQDAAQHHYVIRRA